MQDIRRQFLKSSALSLNDFKKVLQTEDEISEQFARQLYRRIHTIKGTAQTFGLTNSANLAHELENILSLAGSGGTEQKKMREILISGLDFLSESLEDPDFVVPLRFADEIRKIAPGAETVRGVFLSIISPEVFSQLTEFEKNKIAAALKDNKNLYRLDVVFDFADFSADFKNLQDLIQKKGEIIFTLPAETNNAADKIGFQIYFSGSDTTENLQAEVNKYDAKVFLQTSNTVFSNDLRGVLSNIVSQGKNWGKTLGKDVKVTIFSDEPDLSTDTLKLVFDILLHLVKNSIDHSIEEKGTVEIRIREENGSLQITVADDGRGIDLEKIRAKAVEKNLILPDTPLSEQETLELIYLSGFSTAEKVTEISGRGVGLDAVRDLVVNTGGTIGVETNKGKGTTFEIFLPVK